MKNTILDLLIIGAGGNGQTYFMQFCQKNGLKINDINDTDKLKHMSSPNDIPANLQIKKCIFIYNEPHKAILSHFRRGWSYVQMVKLGNPYKLQSTNINPLEKYINLVIENKKDMFGIEYQFNNWFNAKTDFPILFLDFNEILNKKEKIDHFLDKTLDYTSF
jgi:hypothetical protein